MDRGSEACDPGEMADWRIGRTYSEKNPESPSGNPSGIMPVLCRLVF